MDTTTKAQPENPHRKRIRHVLDFTPHHAQLLQRAAQLKGETLAGFVRRTSLEQAAKDLKSPDLRQLALPRTGTG